MGAQFNGWMENMDAIQSYLVAFILLSFTTVMDNAPTIMTVGGMLLLAIRLAVDGVRLYRVWRYGYDN